jgi:tetratricopeptide (TPR) repeat protein
MRRLLAGLLLLGCSKDAPAPATAPASAAPASAPASAAAGAPAGAAASDAPPSAPAPGELPPGTEAQDARFEAAQAALAAGDEAAALPHLLAASEGPVTGTRISASLAAADLLTRKNRPAEARALYEALLSAAGHLAEVQFTAGRFFAGQEEPDRAIEAFQAAVRVQPDFLPAYTLLGALMVQKGLKEEAAGVLLEYERRLVDRLRQAEAPRSPEAERLATIDLLAVLVDERAEGTLRRLLADPSPAIRMAAAVAVADQEEPEALVALANALTAEHDYTARQVLKQALVRARERALRSAPESTSP